MPVENLNLQIIIPKLSEMEGYKNTLHNINQNTRDIEMFLDINNINNLYKKVYSTSNSAKNNMLVITDNNGHSEQEKRKYKYNSTGRSEAEKVDNVAVLESGHYINIKI
ncbi:hypothetical protein [Calorimonas adulescens]|jgi:hypothetical protein|uniref:Uncharacterized protein n=1 Tax=Calorimonas adulescens TaxID=2606906 RepID=A0A5D8QHG3_9THEO|nr:hypothetical protein [Calorimonas adulescens]TZE83326.1 hypothetical protein FWJ32_00110 [Calorimonas adulescens]